MAGAVGLALDVLLDRLYCPPLCRRRSRRHSHQRSERFASYVAKLALRPQEQGTSGTPAISVTLSRRFVSYAHALFPRCRQFITTQYPVLKQHNPDLPILIREAKGTPARVFARFGAYYTMIALKILSESLKRCRARCREAHRRREPICFRCRVKDCSAADCIMLDYIHAVTFLHFCWLCSHITACKTTSSIITLQASRIDSLVYGSPGTLAKVE